MIAIARPRSEPAPDRRVGAFALSLCLLALAWPVWAQASASTPHADAYAAATAAWRPAHAVGALSFAFALAVGWRANARGWPLALAAPAALL
ncbi:hypothetical protein, partial [Lysobacter enzymogenes]|uniref:hypothetical protein n=1 Tax=Lysobacter enzymogenes TaxID=69 RepID=UPI0019D14AA2